MIRRASPDDAPAIEAFLARHPDTSMFLRGNLEAHGIDASDHDHASTYFLWPDTGEIRAVFGCSNHGFLMIQAPGQEDEALSGAVHALAGREVQGLTGETGQVRAWLSVLGLRDALRYEHVEPLYRLDLSELDESDDAGRLPREEDLDLLTEWYAQYEADTGLGNPDPVQRAAEGRARARRAIAGSTVLVMTEGDRPVAMAEINAQVADHVQVGGVFVPPAARGRGLGRRVTALLLCRARANGARVAILFANNPAAARAYEAIGFRRVGDYMIALTDGPATIAATGSS